MSQDGRFWQPVGSCSVSSDGRGHSIQLANGIDAKQALEVIAAAYAVGFELALKRITRAPYSKAPAGLSYGEIRNRGEAQD